MLFIFFKQASKRKLAQIYQVKSTIFMVKQNEVHTKECYLILKDNIPLTHKKQ